MTEIVADKTVEVVKNAIETADGALDLYNKYLDQVIPWQTFDETIKELSRFKQEYSQAASVLVGDIKTLLMDSQDKYFEATQTVSGAQTLIPLPSGTKIWLVAGITDMRNGFNGLAAKVQTTLKDDPMSGHVFIFRGRNGSQVKLLWSTGDGLCLLTKRLERGRFAWPSARDGKVFLTPAQLAMLLEGIDWRQPKRLLTSLTML